MFPRHKMVRSLFQIAETLICNDTIFNKCKTLYFPLQPFRWCLGVFGTTQKGRELQIAADLCVQVEVNTISTNGYSEVLQ